MSEYLPFGGFKLQGVTNRVGEGKVERDLSCIFFFLIEEGAQILGKKP